MTVWVLDECVEWEGVFMVGIYSDYDKAVAARDQIIERRKEKFSGDKSTASDFDISQYVIDEGYTMDLYDR